MPAIDIQIAGESFKWIVGVFAAAAIPFILYMRKYTEDLLGYKENDILQIGDSSSVVDSFRELFHIYRTYDQYESDVSITYWSYFGIILFSVCGSVCSKVHFNTIYVIPFLVTSFILFSIKFVWISWKFVNSQKNKK